MTRKFKTNVIGVDSKGNFDEMEREITYPGHDKPNGIGKFINDAAYDKYMNGTYGDDIRKLEGNINDNSVEDKKIVFDVGKTTLLMILAQEGCEGLRLVQCNNKDGLPTLVVKGFLGKVKPVTMGASTNYLPAPMINNSGEEVMSEEVHGITLREIIQLEKDNGIPRQNGLITFSAIL